MLSCRYLQAESDQYIGSELRPRLSRTSPAHLNRTNQLSPDSTGMEYKTTNMYK